MSNKTIIIGGISGTLGTHILDYFASFDNDIKISKLIKGSKVKLIFLSSRKIYKSGPNLKENSKLNPRSNYSKNKLITERKLSKILNFFNIEIVSPPPITL